MKYRHSTTHLLPEVEAKYPYIVDIEMNQNRTKMIGSALYREIKRNVAMIKQRHLCVERGTGEKRGGERGEGEDAAITDDYPAIGQSRPVNGAGVPPSHSDTHVPQEHGQASAADIVQPAGGTYAVVPCAITRNQG